MLIPNNFFVILIPYTLHFFLLIVDAVGPGLVSLFDKCLCTGSVPATFKVATVTLILKKPSLDSSVLNNFRPISVIPFISKVLEKIVFEQLQSFLSCNGISEMFQSGFKSVHSTKIALLRVLNSISFIYRLWSSCF